MVRQNEKIELDSSTYVQFFEIFNSVTNSKTSSIAKQKFITWLNSQKIQ
jgi:hypothetical protein